jgi:hypothetical protein
VYRALGKLKARTWIDLDGAMPRGSAPAERGSGVVYSYTGCRECTLHVRAPNFSFVAQGYQTNFNAQWTMNSYLSHTNPPNDCDAQRL